jgi:hypothetical protein
MAIADAISDLFNCGRPRRPQTRDSAKPGEDALRMTDVRVGATLDHASDETPPNISARDNATPQSVPEGGLLHIVPLEPHAPIDTSTLRTSPEATPVRSIEDVKEEVPQSRTRRDQEGDQRVKPGKATQIEQRFLVTTDTPDAGRLAAFELDLQNDHTTDEEVTPVLEASDTIRTSPVKTVELRPETVEKQAPEAAQTSPADTNELKAEEVVKHAATHESADTKALDDRSAIPTTASTISSQELGSAIVNPVVKAGGPQLPQRRSIQFLSLPTGM